MQIRAGQGELNYIVHMTARESPPGFRRPIMLQFPSSPLYPSLRPRLRPARLLALLALAALAGCAQPVGQCEGGLDGLSSLSNVAVQNPC
jgi:hypothetical protein